jgi:hypothetical protein
MTLARDIAEGDHLGSTRATRASLRPRGSRRNAYAVILTTNMPSRSVL